jgi:hypothetical protein
MNRDAHEKRIISTPGGVYRRSAKPLILAFIFVLFFYPALVNGGARITNKEIPFSPGERLTYEGYWGPIPAGDVTLEVLPKETIDGVEAYHFMMITKTNAAVDLLYKVREMQDSFVDSHMTHSILYKKRAEGKYPREIIVNFDWDKFEATHTNFGEKSPPISILSGSFDPLALLFILRLQDFKEDSVIEIPVTDGHMNYRVKATVGKRDSIEIQGKLYPAFEITPDMERLENIAAKNENQQIKIWYAADERKIPLRIWNKSGIVSFVFDLMSIAP